MSGPVYFYGVVPSADTLPSIEGIDDESQVTTIVVDALAAAVSPVDPALFAAGEGQDALQALTGFILKHDAIIQEIFEEMTILPAPFGTVFGSAEDITALITRQQAHWQQTLDHIDGCVELGIKAYVKDGLLLEETVQAHLSPQADKAGTNYMRRKQAEMRAQKEVDGRVNTVLSDLHRRLSDLARDAVIKSVDGAKPSDDGRLALRSIYLIEDEKVDTLLTVLREVGGEHPGWLTLQSDDTFAPYHFVGNMQ